MTTEPRFDTIPDISVGPIDTNWYLEDETLRPIVRSAVTVMRSCQPFSDEELPRVELAVRELLSTHDYEMTVNRGLNSEVSGYIEFEVIQWKA